MSLDYYLEDKRVSWMDSIVCFGICLAIVTVISVVDTTTYRKAGTGEFLAVGNPIISIQSQGSFTGVRR